jgi:protein SCO1/2
MVREPPLEVGDVTTWEVDAGGAETEFRFRAPDDGLLLVAFGYTHCPDVCPTTLSDFRTAVRELGDDADRVEVAFYTVDPQRDTPEILNAYLGSFFPGGHPLRSDGKVLRAAEDAFSVTSKRRVDRDSNILVTHTARSFVVDEDGVVLVEWAFGAGSQVMAEDLRILLDRIDTADEEAAADRGEV